MKRKRMGRTGLRSIDGMIAGIRKAGPKAALPF